MKTGTVSNSSKTSLLFSLFALFLGICQPANAEDDDMPVGLRMGRIGGLVQRLLTLSASDSITSMVLQGTRGRYKIVWNSPKINAVCGDVSAEEAITSVINSISGQLPLELSPKKTNVLTVLKVRHNDEDNRWIWFVEFAVDDKSPRAGSPYKATLVAPVDCNGVTLAQVLKN